MFPVSDRLIKILNLYLFIFAIFLTYFQNDKYEATAAQLVSPEQNARATHYSGQ